MKGVKIVGIGHYCPSNVVSNEYISSLVDTSDDWIVKRTGIKERRISEGEGTVDLAVKAGEEALKNSGARRSKKTQMRIECRGHIRRAFVQQELRSRRPAG